MPDADMNGTHSRDHPREVVHAREVRDDHVEVLKPELVGGLIRVFCALATSDGSER